MKRFSALLLSLLVATFGLLPLTVAAAATNLVANPSAEVANPANTTLPDGWAQGNWGTNTTSFSYDTAAHTGSHSLKVQTSAYTDGDAKWYFAPANVTAGTQYNFSDFYKATTPTDVVVQFDNGSNYSYQWLKTVPAAASWTQATGTFTIPAGFTHATVFHLLNSVGTLQTDDYSLTAVVPNNLSVAVTAPIAGASVSGNSVQLSATASSADGVAGVQFKVDGANVGTEVTAAPYTTAWNTSALANGSHSITAVARDTDGTLVTSAAVTVTVANTVAAGTNLIPNPSVETTVAGNTKAPANWQSSKWGTNTTTFTYLASGAHTGSHALKVQMAKYTDGDAKWTYTTQAVDPSKLYDFSDYYKATTESYVVVDFTMANGTDQYVTLGTLQKNTNWTKFEEQFSVPVGAASFTVFHIISSVGQVTTDDYSLSSYQPIGFNRAVVSLTFDDAWASVYNNALPILQKYQFASTQYLISGNTADPDYMNQQMMLALKNAGQEIASHTVTHPDLVTLTATQLKTELNQSQKDLQKYTGATVTDFASPYGSMDASVLAQVKKYYKSQRGVVAGFNSKNYFDAYDIKVQDIESNTSLAQVQAWIAQAQATKTWLVLVYHQVSTDTAAGDYNTTPAQLDAQLNAVKQSGIPVETVSQALAELQAQL